MSGGKGGRQTTSVELPQWLDSAAQDVVARAMKAGRIGYVPYSGPDVAAFTPMQQAAFDASNMAAQAFGLPTATSALPPPTQFAGGVMGYASKPLYDQSVAAMRPGQRDAINSMFINPWTV